MILFYAVGHWNNYVDALIFITKEEYWPLQVVLRDILVVAETQAAGAGDTDMIEAPDQTDASPEDQS